MKIRLDLYLPAAGQSYETSVENNVPLSRLTGLIAQAVERIAGGTYRVDSNPILCDRHTGTVLDINMTLGELGLKNGSSVMLI